MYTGCHQIQKFSSLAPGLWGEERQREGSKGTRISYIVHEQSISKLLIFFLFFLFFFFFGGGGGGGMAKEVQISQLVSEYCLTVCGLRGRGDQRGWSRGANMTLDDQISQTTVV